MKTTTLVLTLLFFVFKPALATDDTVKVLFVGNSFLNGYSHESTVPDIFVQIALSQGKVVYMENRSVSGYSLSSHAGNSVTLNKINSQNWDYVVLQEVSWMPGSTPTFDQTFFTAANTLNQVIKNNDTCTNTLFFMTWGYQNGDSDVPGDDFFQMQDRLTGSYLTITDSLNALVSPVGEVFRKLKLTGSTINFYDADGYHPNMNGAYTAACGFYSTIFQSSVVGAYVPSSVDALEAFDIQQATDSAVLHAATNWFYENKTTCSDPFSIEAHTSQLNKSQQGLNVYPNPNQNGTLNITLNNDEAMYSVSIMDLQGRTVLQGSLAKGQTQINIDGLAKGMYLVKFGDQTQKLIIE